MKHTTKSAPTKSPKKLALDKSRLRVLHDAELARVTGGDEHPAAHRGLDKVKY